MLTAVVTAEGGVGLLCEGFDENAKTGTSCEKHEATTKNPVLPETNELIYSLIAFLLLAVLFMKFAFPLVKKTMEARTERIRSDLDGAERLKAEAEGVLSEYSRQLADAKGESNRIIEESRQQAQKVKDDIVASASAEVAQMKARATQDIEAARAAAIASVQGAVGGLAIELAEKVVERNLDRETNQRLVESLIAQIGSR